jgi:hypothetical protein
MSAHQEPLLLEQKISDQLIAGSLLQSFLIQHRKPVMYSGG